MEIDEAYKILGLSNGANEEEVNSSYKELIKKHHPDKSGDSEFSYSLNEARDTLVNYLTSKNSKAVALIVTAALSKYREADKREAELRNELNQIINELSKRPKSKIERLRNYLIIATFAAAILTFITSSSNGLLSLSSTLYPDRYSAEDSLKFMRSILSQDSVFSEASISDSSRIIDSIYNANQLYKKRIDNELRVMAYKKKEYELSRKKYKEMIGLQLTLMTSFGILFIAYMQMKLKAYESNLESFKTKIDNKSKLKKLLRVITNGNRYSKKEIPEYLLQLFIKNLFYDSPKENKLSYELHDAVELGKKLELTDLEKIIILKFSEKSLIEESSLKDETDEIYYSINL
jgi:hypothetical protein